jgi:renalase
MAARATKADCSAVRAWRGSSVFGKNSMRSGTRRIAKRRVGLWEASIRYERGLDPSAVCGAGIAGLACAHRLQQSGYTVTLYDKSRRPGGRCATRRSEVGTFDHGAPKFSARTEEFRTEVSPWRQERWVVSAREEGQWLGVPSMSAMTRGLAESLAVVASTQIVGVERRENGWTLRACDPVGILESLRYDVVVIATPAEQAVPLLTASPVLQAHLRRVHSDPCWAVMAAWDASLRLPAARVAPANGPLAAAWRDDAKPQRPLVNGVAERWVLHGRGEWTRRHLEIGAAAAAEQLLAAFGATVGASLPAPIHRIAHRWRYAQVLQTAGEPFGWDARTAIGSCGDGWQGTGGAEHIDGVERAWLSGAGLAEAICNEDLT